VAAQAESEAQQRDEAASRSVAFVSSGLTKLQQAQTTADVQAAADAAAADSVAASQFPLVDDRTARATKALDALAALKSLNADTLATWPQMRSAVEAATKAAATPSASIDPTLPLGNIDLVVSRGQQALDTWRMQVAMTESANSKERAAVEQYDAQAQAQIARYNQLRNETAD
jgi:hypothetical protein